MPDIGALLKMLMGQQGGQSAPVQQLGGGSQPDPSLSGLPLGALGQGGSGGGGSLSGGGTAQGLESGGGPDLNQLMQQLSQSAPSPSYPAGFSLASGIGSNALGQYGGSGLGGGLGADNLPQSGGTFGSGGQITSGQQAGGGLDFSSLVKLLGGSVPLAKQAFQSFFSGNDANNAPTGAGGGLGQQGPTGVFTSGGEAPASLALSPGQLSTQIGSFEQALGMVPGSLEGIAGGPEFASLFSDALSQTGGATGALDAANIGTAAGSYPYAATGAQEAGGLGGGSLGGLAGAGLSFLGPLLGVLGKASGSPELGQAGQAVGLGAQGVGLASNIGTLASMASAFDAAIAAGATTAEAASAASAAAGGALGGAGAVAGAVTWPLLVLSLLDAIEGKSSLGEAITGFSGGPKGISKMQEGSERWLAAQNTIGASNPFAQLLGTAADYPHLQAILQSGEQGKAGINPQIDTSRTLPGMHADNPIQGYMHLTDPGAGYLGAMIQMPNGQWLDPANAPIDVAYQALQQGGQVIPRSTTATGQNLPGGQEVANILNERIREFGGLNALGGPGAGYNAQTSPMIDALTKSIMENANNLIISGGQNPADPYNTWRSYAQAPLQEWGVPTEQGNAMMGQSLPQLLDYMIGSPNQASVGARPGLAGSWGSGGNFNPAYWGLTAQTPPSFDALGFPVPQTQQYDPSRLSLLDPWLQSALQPYINAYNPNIGPVLAGSAGSGGDAGGGE